MVLHNGKCANCVTEAGTSCCWAWDHRQRRIRLPDRCWQRVCPHCAIRLQVSRKSVISYSLVIEAVWNAISLYGVISRKSADHPSIQFKPKLNSTVSSTKPLPQKRKLKMRPRRQPPRQRRRERKSRAPLRLIARTQCSWAMPLQSHYWVVVSDLVLIESMPLENWHGKLWVLGLRLLVCLRVLITTWARKFQLLLAISQAIWIANREIRYLFKNKYPKK